MDLPQVDGGAHAPSHRFAVEETRVAGLGLERMAEGVAEIENAAEVAFALVARDHFAFHPHGIGDDAVDRRVLARQHRGAVFGEIGEQLRTRG